MYSFAVKGNPSASPVSALHASGKHYDAGFLPALSWWNPGWLLLLLCCFQTVAHAASAGNLLFNASSVAFGQVTVDTSVTQELIVTCTGSAAVTITSAKVTGTEFRRTRFTLPATLKPGQSATIYLEFDPMAAGAATGKLSIVSNAANGGTLTLSLSGTGESQTVVHQVDLSWGAPTSSPDPVTGYHIYRSSGGSSAFQLLNSSPDVATTYVDSAVQAGATYDYEVKSVDASGNESSPTGPVAVTIP